MTDYDPTAELSNNAREALVAQRNDKKPWYEITPKDAAAQQLRLPSPDIWGPLTEYGGECPWPWEPQQLAGVPMGQYRCKYCNAMVLAGIGHMDYMPGWDDAPPEHYAQVDAEGNDEV